MSDLPDISRGISVSLRQRTLNRMKARARSMDRSVSWLLNHAAEDYMDRNPDPAADAEAESYPESK